MALYDPTTGKFKQGGDIWGNLGAGGYSALDETLLGLPSFLVKNIGGKDTWNKLDQFRKDHKLATDIGGGAGFLGSMLIPGGAIAKGASKLAKFAKLGKLAEKLGKASEMAKMSTKGLKGFEALKTGAKAGAVQALEQAIPRAITGLDKEDLPGSAMKGIQDIGTGALFGGAAGGTIGRLFDKISPAIKNAAGEGKKLASDLYIRSTGVEPRDVFAQFGGMGKGFKGSQATLGAEDFKNAAAKYGKERGLQFEQNRVQNVLDERAAWEKIAGKYDDALKTSKKIIPKKGVTQKDAINILQTGEVPENMYIHGRSAIGDADDQLENGFGQMTKSIETGKQYAGESGEVWGITPKESANIIDYSTPYTKDMDKLIENIKYEAPDPDIPPEPFLSDIAGTYGLMDDINNIRWNTEVKTGKTVEDVIREAYAPENIVTSAGAFDNPEWSNFAGSGVSNGAIIKTPNGGAVVNDWELVNKYPLKKISKEAGESIKENSSMLYDDIIKSPAMADILQKNIGSEEEVLKYIAPILRQVNLADSSGAQKAFLDPIIKNGYTSTAPADKIRGEVAKAIKTNIDQKILDLSDAPKEFIDKQKENYKYYKLFQQGGGKASAKLGNYNAGSNTMEKLAMAGLGGAGGFAGTGGDITDPEVLAQKLKNMAIGSATGFGVSKLSTAAMKKLLQAGGNVAGTKAGQALAELAGNEIGKIPSKLAGAIPSKIGNEPEPITPTGQEGTPDAEKQATTELEAGSSEPAKAEAQAEFTDQYKNTIATQLRYTFDTYYANNPDFAGMSFEDFAQRVKKQTNGFDPVKSSKLLFPDNPEMESAYLKKYQTMLYLKNLDAEKSLSKTPGFLGIMPSEYADEDNYQKVRDLMINLASGGKIENMDSANMQKMVDEDLSRIMKTKGVKKAALLDMLTNKYGLDFSDLGGLGLT